MMNDKISVIIPVYNVEAYIARCLDSLLGQTYKNFEVICIDDGSTDGSGVLCDEYSGRDSRIITHHIPNAGVGNARNTGIAEATGEWFAFVDADDWVEPEYLEILLANALKNDCEISACCYVRDTVYEMKKVTSNKVLMLNSPKECIHNFICSGLSLNGMVWNKLYRKELFDNVRFDVNIRVNEDCLYTYHVMEKCSRACVSSARLYHWFYRPDSACHSKKRVADFGPADVFMELYRLSEPLNDEGVGRKLKQNYISSAMTVLLHAKYSSRDAEVRRVKKQCRQWKKEVWQNFDLRTRLKYILCFYLKP